MRLPSVDSCDDSDQLVIALDFGTTFSGVAYSFSTDPENIYTVTNWPGGEDRIVPKTPTVMKYEDGSTERFQWGYQLDMAVGDRITALKLLLDPNQERPYPVSIDVQEEIRRLPKNVVDVAADYMKAIYDHAVEEIEADSLDPSFLDAYEKRFILTVPAVWSDKAKSRTLKAARKAGIKSISMITEPEAAALYTLHSMRSKGLKCGDVVLICDAGGGTVDLVSYEIQGLSPFKLKTLTAPSGGLCGSLMVNKLFEKEVRTAVGRNQYPGLQGTEAYRCALRDFDLAIKPAFRGPGDRDKYVSFPMARLRNDPALGVVNDSLVLTGETMKRIFDPIVQRIEDLVSAQIAELRMERLHLDDKWEQIPKAIFMAGGFGSSAYLRSRIEESQPGVQVVQPKEAWSAIVRGAAMSQLGIAPIVTTSKAPKHYGVSVCRRWNESRDQGFEMVIDPWEEVERCTNMHWYIHKDDNLVRDEKIKQKVYCSFSKEEYDLGLLDHKSWLLESNASIAPTHPTADVRINCSMKVNLRHLPESQFAHMKRRSDGAPYVSVHYSLVVENNQSGLMTFSLEADGKEYAAVEAMY